MWTDKDFDELIDTIVSQKLGMSIMMMDNYFFTRSLQPGRELLGAIKSDYALLADYWQKGYDDSQRSQLYMKLLQRMYGLVADTMLQSHLAAAYPLATIYHRSHDSRQDLSAASVKNILESYVSDVALLELEPEHTRQQKMDTIYRDHQQFMDLLFGWIITSPQWKESEGVAFEALLLSPTIDVKDQLLLISALTIAAQNIFDITKFKILATVYEQASDEEIRQRSLVGWVLTADDRLSKLFPEMKSIVSRLCKQSSCRQELVELQMQITYCMSADDDSRRIREEIMPDLMKGNHIQMTHQGLVETEEDQLENILHPDAAEKSMEQMEASMKKMVDMQRRGSDIYFAGFSQMKRFPFFNELSNWFMPFTPQHPAISTIWQQAKGKKFLQMITKMGAFCDSDKYSFVLAFEQVLNHLPSQMLQMIENGEASPMAVGGEVPLDDQRQPAFIRRIYLQNLFRFFRLCSQRSYFVNPFQYPDAVFFKQDIYRGTSLEQSMSEVASFLGKHNQVEEAITILQGMNTEDADARYFLLLGQLMMSHQGGRHDTLEVAGLFKKALSLLVDQKGQKEYERALKGYARAAFLQGDYQRALNAYEELLTLVPEHHGHQLNAAICRVKLKDYDEALKGLYKLNYENADDPFVNSTMAWTLTLTGKYEQARRLYDQLLSIEKRNATDVLNCGYCLWFERDIKGAVSLMRQYVEMQEKGLSALEDDMLLYERELLSERGIDMVEIWLMIDAVRA